MSFDWSDYLNLAHKLIASTSEHGMQEAALRCAISRSYYAVFCTSRNYLRDIDREENLDTYEVHKIVSEIFMHSSNTNKKRIGENLKRLRGMRNKADYNDNFSGLASQAKFALKIADAIISDLGNL
jgi:uncharacterized protein (UPF0332 family)